MSAAGPVAEAIAAREHWVHDLDPCAVPIAGDFCIRWYGLAYLAGLLIGWWLVRRWCRRGLLPFPEAVAGDMVLYLGLGMILGGRIGYVLFYQSSLLWSFGDGFPWWGLLRINQGGMASHGGIIGFFVGGWLFSRRYRCPFWVMADAVATAAPIGVVFGRIANFVNGELWGRPSDVPWAVIFPQSAGLPPAALAMDPAEQAAAADRILAWQILNAAPRHPSQLYAAFFEGLLVLAIALPLYGRHRRPGLNLGAVLSVYALGRFVDEFWREPDRGYELFFGWMSKGQALSLPVLAFGVFFVARALRRPPRPELYQPVPAPAAR